MVACSWNDISQTIDTCCRKLDIPEGMSVSFPLPFIDQNTVLDAVMIYGRDWNQNQFLGPVGFAQIDCNKHELVRYIPLETADKRTRFVPIKHTSSGIAEYNELTKLYEQLRLFAFQPALTQADQQILRAFITLWTKYNEKELQALYIKVFKDFFAWISNVISSTYACDT